MLYLDSPVGSFFGITVFRDHADPDLFYYASERPRLSVNDDTAEFVFLIYQNDVTDNAALSDADKDQLGGGFLAFTVDLGVDEEVLKEVRKRLGAIAEGTPKLAPLQYRTGTVRLSITKDVADAPGAAATETKGASFFEQVYGTSKPSLMGDNRATFGVMMDHEGARLVEAALKSGISPIGVIYDLEYLGMRPAFNVKITAEYKRIYEHLEMEFGVRGGVGPIAAAVDIGLAWQKLRENGDIKVEVINFTDDENFRKQADAAFDWFKTELLRDFFKSSLEPPGFMRAGQPAGGLAGALQSLIGPLSETQQGSTPTMGAPTTLAPTPAAPPSGLDSGAVSTASRNTAATTAPASAGGGGAAGATGSGASFGLQIGFSLKRYVQDELKTRSFEYSMQAAVSREAAPQGLFSTMVDGVDLTRAIKRVSLADDFFKHVNATFAVSTDLASADVGIDLIAVNIEYPGVRPEGTQPDQVGGFRFTKTDQVPKTFRTFLNDKLDLRYRYKIDVHFSSDSVWEGNEPHFTSDWIVETGQAPQINPLDIVDTLDLTIALAKDIDKDEVKQVEVQVVYDDPAHAMHGERSFVFEPGGADQSWKLRFVEGGSHGYRYRTIYSLKDNVRYTTDWTEKAGDTLEDAGIVVRNPYQNRKSLTAISLLDNARLIEASVDLLYVDSESGVERRERVAFGPNESAGAIRHIDLPTIAAHPTSIRYAISVVKTDGTVFETPMTEAPIDKKIIVSDGVGETRIVRVSPLGGDIAGAGLAAMRVRVHALDTIGDSDEVLFRPGDVTPRTLTLTKAPDEAFKYHFRVEGFTAMGLPVTGAEAEETTLELLVAAPRA